MPRKGFAVCRHCGKIQKDRGQKDHALTCTVRNQDDPENFTEFLYLYREFSSEAIRMLLPMTTFAGSEKKLHSFTAALHLGLKRKFRGSIDHLATTEDDEPVPGSDVRKKYLVLFDKVPGGTGYLKQLMRSEKPLMEVFELALDALRSCSCNNDPEKDGCYRCLFAYRHSHTMEATSRDAAVELLSGIVGHKDRLVPIDSLRRVSINVLFDSELEARFIEALRKPDEPDTGAALSKLVFNGKPGYFYRIGERAWYIEPQVSLGEKQNVAIPSKADFVLYPARDQDTIRPIVVFVDGYAFHANRVGLDLAQRMALVRSGRYWVWSLTWKDVENRYKSGMSYFVNLLDPMATQARSVQDFLKTYDIEEASGLHEQDSFQWLFRLLSRPESPLLAKAAMVHAFRHLNPLKEEDPQAMDEWREQLGVLYPAFVSRGFDRVEGNSWTGHTTLARDRTHPGIELHVKASKKAVASGDANGLCLACLLDDSPEALERGDFDRAWNGALRAFNLFQFLPSCFFLSRKGVADQVYAALETAPVQGPGPDSLPDDRAGWKDVFDMTDPQDHPLVQLLMDRAWPVPEAGYELANAKGAIIGEAELAWEDLEIALADAGSGMASAFENAGWTVVSVEQARQDPEALASLFHKQETIRNA